MREEGEVRLDVLGEVLGLTIGDFWGLRGGGGGCCDVCGSFRTFFNLLLFDFLGLLGLFTSSVLLVEIRLFLPRP